MNLGEIAAGINQNEFDGAASPSVTSISGWLSGNLGGLNSLIYSDFSYTGDFNPEESAIFSAYYLRDFYKKEAGRAMRGLVTGSSSSSLLSVKEGDSTISFVNRSEVSKSLMALSKQYGEDFNEMVAKYNIYNAFPRQSAGEDCGYPLNSMDIPHTGTGYYGY